MKIGLKGLWTFRKEHSCCPNIRKSRSIWFCSSSFCLEMLRKKTLACVERFLQFECEMSCLVSISKSTVHCFNVTKSARLGVDVMYSEMGSGSLMASKLRRQNQVFPGGSSFKCDVDARKLELVAKPSLYLSSLMLMIKCVQSQFAKHSMSKSKHTQQLQISPVQIKHLMGLGAPTFSSVSILPWSWSRLLCSVLDPYSKGWSIRPEGFQSVHGVGLHAVSQRSTGISIGCGACAFSLLWESLCASAGQPLPAFWLAEFNHVMLIGVNIKYSWSSSLVNCLNCMWVCLGWNFPGWGRFACVSLVDNSWSVQPASGGQSFLLISLLQAHDQHCRYLQGKFIVRVYAKSHLNTVSNRNSEKCCRTDLNAQTESTLLWHQTKLENKTSSSLPVSNENERLSNTMWGSMWTNRRPSAW